MKGLIIFKGKYGATTQYAQWLSESLNIAATDAGKVNSEHLEKTDYLLIGTSIYMGKFLLKTWLENHADEIRSKKLFFFIVTGTPLSEKKALAAYTDANIPQEIKNNAEVFFLPGRLVVKKLSWMDKLFLKIGASFAKTPEIKKRMLTDYDNVKKDHLAELLISVSQFLPKVTQGVS